MSFKKEKPTWREEKQREVPPEDREMLKEANNTKKTSLDSEKTNYKEHIDAA